MLRPLLFAFVLILISMDCTAQTPSNELSNAGNIRMRHPSDTVRHQRQAPQSNIFPFIQANSQFNFDLYLIKSLQGAIHNEAKILHKKRQLLIASGMNTAMMDVIDSFEKAAIKAIDVYADPVVKANVYMVLADAYDWRTEGSERQLVLYKEAARLYRESGRKKDQGLALIQLGQSQLRTEALQDTEISLNEAVRLLAASGYQRLQMAYMGLSHVYISTGRYKEGTQYGLEAVRVGERFKDTSIDMADVYKNLGYCYEIASDPANAAIYFRKALSIAKRNGSVVEIYASTAQIAKLMVRNSTDSAIGILKGLLRQYPLHPRTQELREAYIQLLRCYNRKKQLDDAGFYAGKVLEFANALPATSLYRNYALSPVIDYYILSRQYQEAAGLLSACRVLEEKHGQLPALSGIYSRLYKVDSARNDYKAALNSYKLWKRTIDSLEALAQTKQVAELRVAFETEQQEKNIALLQKENYLKSERIKRSALERNAVMGLALLLLIIFCLLYYQFHQKKVANRHINAKNLVLEKLLQEKEWLLKEVHHRVKNNLQTVVSLLESQAAGLRDEALNAIHESQHRVFAISLIHKKLYLAENIKTVDMSSYIPELVGYINEMIGKAAKLIFSYDIADINLDVSHAVPVGLIINEAVTNAIKYAFTGAHTGQNKISIAMKRKEDDHLQMIIEDNGRGLPADLLKGGGAGFGLRLLFGLTEDLGGNLVISNENGTKIILEFSQNPAF
jgi:two-component sensor histidine kinase